MQSPQEKTVEQVEKNIKVLIRDATIATNPGNEFFPLRWDSGIQLLSHRHIRASGTTPSDDTKPEKWPLTRND